MGENDPDEDAETQYGGTEDEEPTTSIDDDEDDENADGE